MPHKRLTTGTLHWDEIDVLCRFIDVIKSGNLSSGHHIDEFEHEIAKLHGKKHGIFVNSGQSALEVSLILAKEHLRKDKLTVLMPATTYAADLWAILNTGNIPIFDDVDSHDFCLLNSNKQCDVVIPVDLCGHVNNREWDSSKFVIEDACQALGNSYCNYGDIICFSFYVSHHLTTGCGGMLCLNDSELAEYARSYIAHGRTYGGDFTKYTQSWVDRFTFDKIGASYRGDCLHAALGLSQLKDLLPSIEQRKRNARQLRDALSVKSTLKFLPSDDYIEKSVFQFFPIILPTSQPRTIVLSKLYNEYNIDSRVLFPLTTQPIFKQLFGTIDHTFPNSSYLNNYGCMVGCHQDMTEEDINYMSKALSRVIL